MDKSVSIIIEEFKQNLVQTINNSGLHISIASLVLEQICSDVRATATQVLQQEVAEYKKTAKQKQKEASE